MDILKGYRLHKYHVLLRYHLPPVKKAISTRQVITSVVEVVEKKKPSFTADRQ